MGKGGEETQKNQMTVGTNGSYIGLSQSKERDPNSSSMGNISQITRAEVLGDGSEQ